MTESELSEIDELVEIEDRTNSDGTVNVTIEGWEKCATDGSAEVEFELIDSTEKETMAWPEPGGDLEDYKFYRLVRQAGLEMRNAELLEGEPVHAQKGSDGWTLDVDRPTTTRERTVGMAEQLSSWLASITWKKVIITVFWIMSVGSIVVAILSLIV